MLLVLLIVALLLVTVPQNVVFAHKPIADVWPLDGHLVVDRATAKPSGRWSLVAVGRPELLGESVWNRVRKKPRSRDLRDGPSSKSPMIAKPLAAAAGLNLAGTQILTNPVVVIEHQDRRGPSVTAVAVNGSLADLIALRDALMVMPGEACVKTRSMREKECSVHVV